MRLLLQPPSRRLPPIATAIPLSPTFLVGTRTGTAQNAGDLDELDGLLGGIHLDGEVLCDRRCVMCGVF